jgi:hypothetical protein
MGLIGVALTSVALTAAAVAGLSAASGEEQSLLERCWSPQALAETASELKPSRNDAKLDLTALKDEAIPATRSGVNSNRFCSSWSVRCGRLRPALR